MKKKYKVFFRRVSSKGQDLTMQISADALYREKYLPEEIMIIDEHAVSANKFKLPERPEMMRLVWMILNNQVDIIYVFDRSRLFRDYYEALYFVTICRQKNVRIIFTSKGHQQATDNTLIEGVLNIVGDIEGKNIARRTEEARRRYPTNKIGYVKQKESKQYVQDPTRSANLKKFFDDYLKVSSFAELDAFLLTYKRNLGTGSETLLKMISDPFYAAYDLSNGKNKLSHVEPYLMLSEFEKIQENESLLSKYKEKKALLKEQNIYQPICGICRKPMIYRFNISEDQAWYTCSRKHSKITLSFDDLTIIINTTLENIIDNLDSENLLKDSKRYFQLIKRPLEYNVELLKKEKNHILEEIILQNEDLQHWREQPRYQELANLERTINDSLSKITSTEQLLLKNENIVLLLKDYLNSGKASNPYFLYSMLIEKLHVFENEVKLEINCFDYMLDIQKTLVLQGGVIL